MSVIITSCAWGVALGLGMVYHAYRLEKEESCG